MLSQLANVTYTQLFLGLASVNTVYWTLTYEMQIYLVVVICVMAAQRLGSLVYLVPFAVGLTFGTHLLNSPFAAFSSTTGTASFTGRGGY